MQFQDISYKFTFKKLAFNYCFTFQLCKNNTQQPIIVHPTEKNKKRQPSQRTAPTATLNRFIAKEQVYDNLRQIKTKQIEAQTHTIRRQTINIPKR